MSARGRERALLAAAFVVLALVAGAWLAIDRHPPEWDYANHLERGVLCARNLAAGDIDAVLSRSSFYPPLVPCLAGVAGRLVPSDVAAAQGVMLGFLALGMVAIYLVGRARVGGGAGVMAAIIFGAAPVVVFHTVRFQLDLPLASMVAVALWLVLRTEGFTRRGPALALGAVVGLGLLVKPPFPVYVLPGALWALVTGIGPRRAVNAGWATLIAVAVSLAWYGPRAMGLAAQIGARSFSQAAESGHPHPFSLAALAIYPTTLPTYFGAAAAVLFAVGLVVAVRRRRGLELVSVLVPFALFLAIQNKNARYTLPILPMAAVVAALALQALRPRARAIVTALVLMLTAAQVSATAFAVPARLAVPGVDIALAVPGPPSAADWHHRDILEAITRHASGRPATVSIVPNHMWFSTANFRYYAVRDEHPVRIVRAWEDVPVGIHYMIVKGGDVGPPWTERKSRRAMAQLEEDADFARAFPVLTEMPLPDGSRATVRVRDLGAGVDIAPAEMADALARAVRASLVSVARDVDGLDVRVDHDAGIVRGQVRRLEILARRASAGELRKPGASVLTVGDLHIVVEELVVNPWAAAHAGRFEPLDARRVRLARGTITAEDFRSFLAATRGFTQTSVRLEPDALAFAIGLPGPDVSGRVRVLSAAGRPFTLDADGVRLGGVPVPAPLVNWVFRNFDPSARLASRLPVPVEIAPIHITPDAIRIAD